MNFSLGKVLGVIGGIIPLVYIGWLLRHFVGVGGGTAEGVAFIGLGPTVIGLSIVGLLLALPLIIKLLRVATGVNRVPGANLKPGEVSDAPAFDADEVFANYMRKRDAGEEGTPAADPSADPAFSDLQPFTPRPGGFGRKTV
ncbi:hypothetical protein [Sphingopyxis sp.]|uniref:hypothetical protein n=1 Tax=Sphingopyxis sp. TaxID=1908224 RepID=UPI002FC8A638